MTRTLERPALVTAPSRARLYGVDIARGLAVVGMLLVDNRGSNAIGRQLVHTPWNGLRLSDVVFPVFLLVVGVSMPFSSRFDRPRAVLWRVVKLLLLGWLILTAKYGWGGFGSGVLGHIAAAYLICWLLLRLPRRAQLPAAAAVFAALTLLLLFVPVPGTGGTTGLVAGQSWPQWLDRAVGQTPSAEAPHAYLPSALTVFLGVLAGRALREHTGRAAIGRLAGAGVGLLLAGSALATILPLNKHVWSPSYVLFTGGIGLLLLALCSWVVDLRGVRRPFRPLEVLGRNAIVAFALSELLFRALLGDHVQGAVVRWATGLTSPGAAAWMYALASIAVVWAVCAGLVRRGVVVRI